MLPSEWFEDPGLTAPTPVTVTDEGRVFGHIAVWGECHTGQGLSIGLDGCTTAPSSESGYAYYRTGVVDTSDGEIAIGNITMSTSHAGDRLGATAAMSHYDNTGTVVADVVTGEDEHGIWFSGAMRPDLTDDQVRAFKASNLSGDWRRIRGNLELVAALAVNVPGFPIPRLSVSASGGRQTALVAAGIVNVPRQKKMNAVVEVKLDQDSVKRFADALEEEMGRRSRVRSVRQRYRSIQRRTLMRGRG